MRLLSTNTCHLNTAVICVTSASERVQQIQTKLKREIIVMEEKIKVSTKQLGACELEPLCCEQRGIITSEHLLIKCVS